MTLSRLGDYLDHIRQAASDAISFVEGLSKDEFLEDRRTQQPRRSLGHNSKCITRFAETPS